MTLCNVVRAQEEVLTLKSGSATTKMTSIWPKTRPPTITPKICSTFGSVKASDSCYIDNHHSVFTKGPQVKLLALKRRFQHHKVAQQP